MIPPSKSNQLEVYHGSIRLNRSQTYQILIIERQQGSHLLSITVQVAGPKPRHSFFVVALSLIPAFSSSPPLQPVVFLFHIWRTKPEWSPECSECPDFGPRISSCPRRFVVHFGTSAPFLGNFIVSYEACLVLSGRVRS